MTSATAVQNPRRREEGEVVVEGVRTATGIGGANYIVSSAGTRLLWGYFACADAAFRASSCWVRKMLHQSL
jgi:hypothetical protein